MAGWPSFRDAKIHRPTLRASRDHRRGQLIWRWKYFIVGILLLHLLNSYVYFGNHPFWNFVNATARNLLYPLRWLPLRVGKVDFAAVGRQLRLVFFVDGNFACRQDSPDRTRFSAFLPWF